MTFWPHQSDDAKQHAGRADTVVLMLFLVVLVIVSAGCSASAWNAFAMGMAAGGASPSPVNSQKLMLFGGSGHNTYLGCVNCSQYDSESIFNEYGTFGSKSSSTSIRNPYGQYGSRYSMYGACNPYATDPPVIVDAAGNFYGRLTMNNYHAQRSGNTRLMRWLQEVVCAQ